MSEPRESQKRMSNEFRSAAERIAGCVSIDDVATAMGVSVEDVRTGGGNSEGNDDWRRTLARLAREKANELVELADELDPPQADPNWESAYG